MSALDLAIMYTRKKCHVVPVPHRDKNPGIKGWSEMRLSEDDLPEHFNGRPQNVGVLLGTPSNGLIDLELDCGLAITLAPRCLPATRFRLGHARKRSPDPLFHI